MLQGQVTGTKSQRAHMQRNVNMFLLHFYVPYLMCNNQLCLFQPANASCDNINCGNKLCVEDASGRPRCVTCSCVESDSNEPDLGCSEHFNPMTLCGSDGKSYIDYSSLRKKICTTKTFIKVDHLGPCAGNRHNS